MTDRGKEHLALKAVRARRLTDPLGALGQRRTGDRIEREARLRRGVFACSLAAFAASFALVAATGAPPHAAAPDQPTFSDDLFALTDGLPAEAAAAQGRAGDGHGDGDGDGTGRAASAGGGREAERRAAARARQQRQQEQARQQQSEQPQQARRVHARTQSS